MSRTITVAAMMLFALTAPVWAEDGVAIYEKKCKVCHSIAGVAGPMAKKGGPLDGVGAHRDAAWLRAYFADPRSMITDAKMPKMTLTDAQWEAVTTYMLTLKEAAPGAAK